MGPDANRILVNDPAPEHGQTGGWPRARAWLWRQRNSTRLAFCLRSGSLLATAFLSLFWAKTFVHVLGNEDYGLFLTFLAIAQLGGLGDFGISGAVGVRTIQFLATDNEDEGRQFLATARGVSFLLATVVAVGFILLSPWLPHWLHLSGTPHAGSMPMLLVMGGFGAGLLLLNGFFQSLNYALGNVVWPIVPGFLITQAAYLAQWILISAGAPLWVQYTAHAASVALSIVVVIWFLRLSHPWLGQIRPIRYSVPIATELFKTSFWAYLLSLGTLIYFTVDQIVVNIGFGSAAVPPYRFNYKLCEMSVLLLASATFVALPAIIQRLLSGDPQQRNHGLDGLNRLQRLQCFAGTFAALAYLGVNDTFIFLWLGPGFSQPIALQGAFAINLAVTIAGDAMIHVRARSDKEGLKFAGLTVGACGLLNVALSLIAMKCGSLVGIAAATVFAQLVQMMILARSMCRTLGLPLPQWILRGSLLPLISVLLASVVRQYADPQSLAGAMYYALACIIILVAVAAILNLKPGHFWEELRRLRAECR